jgi:WD40 repeat protein/serine/threonine protein kinase/uncharacterized coiled-coil protein SlyX
MVDNPTSVQRRETARQRVADSGPLSPIEALKLVRSVTAQVARLHQNGQIHRAITLDNIRRENGRWTLTEPSAEPLSLGGPLAESALCPPELDVAAPIELPPSIDAARSVLRAANVPIEPQRIDAYQLGVVLCELVTGQEIEAYMRSPAVKGKVPARVCAVIDRALGFESESRFANVAAVQQALEQFVAKPDSRGLATAPKAQEPPPQQGDTSPSVIRPSSEDDTSPSVVRPAQNDDTSAAPKRPASSRDSAQSIPRRLGHYDIIQRIGQGGMGDVYQAHDTSLDRVVAIKLLPAEFAREEEFIRRFKAEATAAARLTHSNIVQIYAIGEENGQHFFVMQYVEGQSLAQLLKERGKLAVEETLAIVEQALSGLAAAHKHGLVHRDIKPGNILIDREHNRALLADFGLVKSLGTVADRTATGVIMGTVDYISPEQGRGGAVDQRSDLYSIGVLIFHMLSGRLPFEADSPTAMIFQHVYEAPPDLSEVVPGVPAYLAQSVAKLLSKNPADRYESADELLAKWRAWHRGQSRAAEYGPRTAIVTVPEFADSLPPIELVEKPSTVGWWGNLQRRAFGLARRRAPKLVERLLNTRQQVDGAVIEYEDRCHDLEALVTEAEAIILELSDQAQDQRQAAARWQKTVESDVDAAAKHAAQVEQERCERTVSELDQQIAEQQSALDELRLRLSKANATLLSLRNQRDLLNARLQSAEAALQLEEGPPTARLMRRLAIPAIAVALIGIAVIVAAVVIYKIRNQPDPIAQGTPGAGATQPEGSGGGSGDENDTSQRSNVTVDGNTQLYRGATLNEVFKGEVTAIAFATPSYDQRGMPYFPHRFRFAAAGDDASIYLCEVDPQRPNLSSVRRIPGHLSQINQIAYSRDGTRLATASDDKTIKLWDLSTYRNIRTFQGHTKSVTAIVYSPDGTQLLSGSLDGTVRQWDIQTEAEVRKFEMPIYRTNIQSLAWSPDGTTFLVAAGVNGAPSVALWNIAQSRELVVPGDLKVTTSYIQYLGNGSRAILVEGNRHLAILDLRDGRLVRNLEAETGGKTTARSADYSRDGLRALVGDSYGNILLWDLQTFEFERLPAHEGKVVAVSLSADGEKAVTLGEKGDVRTWKFPPIVPSGQVDISRFAKPLRSVRFSPDGFFAVASSDASVTSIGVDGLVYDFGLEEGDAFAAAAVSPSGQTVVSATGKPSGNEIALRAWSTENIVGARRLLRRFAAHDGRITQVAFSLDGRNVISSGDDGKVIVWDPQTEQRLYDIDVGSPVNDFALARGDRLLTADASHQLRLWNYATKEELLAFEPGHTFTIHSVSFSKDGSRAASGGGDRKIFVWDVATGKRIAELTGHTGSVNSVALTPDGTKLLSGSDDGTVRLWHMAETAESRVFVGHVGRVNGVDISPDGKRGISVGTDGTARLWDLAEGGG